MQASNVCASANINATNGYIRQVRTLASTISAYTNLVSDEIVLLAGTNQLITMPACTAVPVGKFYRLKTTVTGLTATVTNATGAQLFNGATSVSLSTAYKYVTLMNDGANWQIFGSN